MKKYNEEYFSVIDKTTGRKIVDCAEYSDALVMLNFDLQNRTITTNKMLMGQVVDIEMPKSLPTTELVVVHTVRPKVFDDYIDNLLEPKKNKLPEGKGQPVRV